MERSIIFILLSMLLSCTGNKVYEYFKENIMNWFQDFQDAHKDIDGYNDELESDYEWSWDDFFDFLGL